MKKEAKYALMIARERD